MQSKMEYAAYTRIQAQLPNIETGVSSIFNKREAFRKCCESDKFKAWHKIETARRLALLKAK